MNVFICYFWWISRRKWSAPTIQVYNILKTDITEGEDKTPWSSGALGIFERVFMYLAGAADHFSLLSKEI